MRAARGHGGELLLVDVDEFGGIDVSYSVMLTKEATLIASMSSCSHDGERDMQQAAEMLAATPEIADALVTHRFPLEDASEAVRMAADRKSLPSRSWWRSADAATP
jgi:threonine dehydrogenase-like Zn-dependent dehydrogenase